jgi:hypothetical protein
MNTSQFIEYALKNGGYTNWLGTEKYTGYIVAVKGHELIIPIDEFKRGATVKQYTECAFDDGYDIVGSWLHEGKVYLDRCRWFSTANEADTFARKNKQLAYYNISGDYVIDIK